MPIYEYKCPECGHRFDLLQPMDAEKKADCEKCGREAKRIFSRVAVKYRGWGFNSTDKLLPESSRSAGLQADLRKGRPADVGGLTGKPFRMPDLDRKAWYLLFSPGLP